MKESIILPPGSPPLKKRIKVQVEPSTNSIESVDPLDMLKSLTYHELTELCLFYKIYKKENSCKEKALECLQTFLKHHPEVLDV